MKQFFYGSVALVIALLLSAQSLQAQNTESGSEQSTMMQSMESGPEKQSNKKSMPDMSGMDHKMDMSANDQNVEHDHPARPVSQDLPIPSLSHIMFPDAMDGYNVQILLKNFTFTPAAINREVASNEGHAHLYINGVKIARIYSNWYHVPSSLFSPGVNAVTVTLNANDHSTWAKPDGQLIASTIPVIRPKLAE